VILGLETVVEISYTVKAKPADRNAQQEAEQEQREHHMKYG